MTANLTTRWARRCVLAIATLGLVTAASFAEAQNRERQPPMLNDDQVELIKVYEVDLDTRPAPRITIPNDKLRDFLSDYQSDDRVPRGRKEQSDWLRADGHEQLRLMFQLKAREYYQHVRIKSQIDSLRAWSTIHRRYILGYFQPTFGKGQVPGLYLFPRDRDGERVELTNFYILTQTTLDGAAMIDRNAPQESLLLQWALPRESAKFPAPDVPGWEPKFKDTDDERFAEHVDWIKSLFQANQGSDYGIEYTLPGKKAEQNARQD
ncbi:MAG: hypothetical protein ACPGYV_09565 [Phycisphaeraceae bacterium]